MNFNDHELLKERLWERPDYYIGEQWDGESVVYSHCRDSDLVNESNWNCFLDTLKGYEAHYHVECASHWGVGWVEYILLRPTAPEKLKDELESMLAALTDYPLLDDEDYSRREWEVVESYWDDDADWLIENYNSRYGDKVPAQAASLPLKEVCKNYPYLWEHVRELSVR